MVQFQIFGPATDLLLFCVRNNHVDHGRWLRFRLWFIVQVSGNACGEDSAYGGEHGKADLNSPVDAILFISSPPIIFPLLFCGGKITFPLLLGMLDVTGALLSLLLLNYLSKLHI